MSALRVVIDARPLSHPQAGGFQSYMRALIAGLRERSADGVSDETLLLYVDRPLSPEAAAALPPGTETRVLDPSRMRSDLRLFSAQVATDAPDLVMGTSNYLPLGLPGFIPQVVTIHDAMGVRPYPWDVGVPRTPRERFINRYWAFLTRRSAHRARLVLTVSAGSVRELVPALGLPKDRFRVIYNGLVGPPAGSVSREADTILVIESPDPRKNVDVVYRALPGLCERIDRPLRLRIVCNGARAEQRVQSLPKLDAHPQLTVETLTGLSDAELTEAYARAAVFVWPSRFEGFGLPPLEAMRQGCAVVSSSAPVMPEILRDVPIYADPDRPEDFADGILRLLTHEEENRARGEHGIELAATYTSRRMADRTVAVWKEALA